MPSKRRARLGALAISAALMGLAAGCGGDDSGTATGASGQNGATNAADGDPMRIAVFSLGFGNSYVQADQKGIEQAADEEGVEVTMFDGGFDASKQYNQVRDAIATGKYDGFLVMPNDGIGIVPALRQAADDDIAVVCMMTACGPDQGSIEAQVPGVVASHVGVSPVKEGVNSAELIVGACGDTDPCEVAWLPGTSSLPTDVARNEALESELKKHPSIDLVAVEEGGFLAEPALKATQNILQAHPEVDVIASAGDQMTAGAEQAVDEAGLTGQVQLIGNAGSAQGVKAVRDGRWYGTTVWPAVDEGRTALETLVAALRGEQVPSSIDMQEKVGLSVITPENADEYDAQWRS